MIDVLREIAAHARSAYPEECCGLLFARGGEVRFVPIVNIAGTARGEGNSARSKRDGYVMDGKAMMAALDRHDAEGFALSAIVHSHPDVGAYFSREDREVALGGGDEPLWPGVDYLVVSVRKGLVDGAKRFRWNGASRAFDEVDVPEIAGF